MNFSLVQRYDLARYMQNNRDLFQSCTSERKYLRPPRDTHKRTGLCWATAGQLLCSTLTIVVQLWRKFSFEPESFNLGQAKRQVQCSLQISHTLPKVQPRCNQARELGQSLGRAMLVRLQGLGNENGGCLVKPESVNSVMMIMAFIFEQMSCYFEGAMGGHCNREVARQMSQRNPVQRITVY